MTRCVVVLSAMLGVAQMALAQAVGDGTATPEPGTLLLLGAGLAGFGFMAWRRNRK